MEKTNSFCAIPFVSTMINTDGKFKYCCIAEGDEDTNLQTNGKKLNVKENSLLDAFNSDTVRKVRKKNDYRRTSFCVYEM